MDAVHQAGAPCGIPQQRLVAQQHELSARCRRRARKRSGLGPLGLGGDHHGRPRTPRQACNAQHGEREDDAGAGAQEARHVAIEVDPQPQLGSVVEIPEREQAQPDRGADDRQRAGDPRRRERHVEHRRTTGELLATQHQRHQQRRQHDGCLVVESLEQRQHDAGAKRRHGQAVRVGQPPRQAPRRQQQERAGQAGAEVRDLDDRQRQRVGQPGQAPAFRRRRGRSQQHAAGQHREDREQLRRHRRGEGAKGIAPLHHLVASLRDLVDDQHQQRPDQRHQVVDHAEQRQGRQHLDGGQPQQQHHQRLEHAEAARHMADERHQLRGQERTEEVEEVGSRGRHQHVEHRRGEDPVEHREQELRSHQPHRRQLDAHAANADRRLPDQARTAGRPTR